MQRGALSQAQNPAENDMENIEHLDFFCTPYLIKGVSS